VFQYYISIKNTPTYATHIIKFYNIWL